MAAALGAELVEPGQREPSDIPLEWDGRVVGALRILPLQGALTRLIEAAERELGAPLGELGREDKQRAVRMLWRIERVANVAFAQRDHILGSGEHRHAVGEEPQDARDDCGCRKRAQSKAKHLQIHACWLAKKG